MRYRDVMAAVLAELAREAGRALAADESDALGRSLPRWPVFDDVPAELDRGARARLAAGRSSPTATAT